MKEPGQINSPRFGSSIHDIEEMKNDTNHDL